MYRLYRLPGSRENWHVDRGPGTQMSNVQSFLLYGPSRSVDVGVDKGVSPHAWIQLDAPGYDVKLFDQQDGKKVACWKNWNLYHSHVCGCGHKFVHHDSKSGDREAHKCPSCGEYVFKQHEMNLPAPETRAFHFDWKRGLIYG